MVITTEVEDPLQWVTTCGIFNLECLSSKAEQQKFQREYAYVLWHLLDYRGKTLGAAVDSAFASYYLENIMKTVEELFHIGVIEVKDDRIVLRKELPSPLEWLARCGD